jgi:hypothetical protein
LQILARPRFALLLGKRKPQWAGPENSTNQSRCPRACYCDAALYITKLPKVEHDAEEWQAAMQALLPDENMTDRRCSPGSAS